MKNICKYLEDPRFIQWVFSPEDELNEWWETFQTNNPLEKENILLAHGILHKFRTTDKVLSEDEKIILFAQILHQIEARQEAKNTRRVFTGLMKYAAVAILFFAIGALLFYQKNNFNPQFYTQEITEPVHSDEARLIRPGGENIILSGPNSRIEHHRDGQVIVNENVVGSSLPQNTVTPEMNQLVIPYGKTSEVTLPDGTRVFLNAGSRLIYPDFFSDKYREVFLTGEAFFDVKHDEKQPFMVQTTDIRMWVLGTQFNVSAYPTDNTIETVLLEGSVAIEKPKTFGLGKDEIILAPNQKASFKKEQNIFSVTDETDVDIYIAWTYGWLKYNRESLISVMRKVERFYNVEIHLPDNYPQDDKITGKLDLKESLKETMQILADASGTEFRILGNKVYVEKKLDKLFRKK
ncbi:MAG: DUF4974 domain-containing protein [Clostridiales bacterium]|nr:DUF4974 domain-containing protein [Clostridiales bacterium]